MTPDMTLAVTITSNNNNSLRLITAMAILMAFTILLITYGSHAVDRHGIAEVTQIRNCMQQNGPTQTWQSIQVPRKFFHVCLLPDGRYGLQMVINKITECVELTCFIPRDATLRGIAEYLGRFAVQIH